jgi:protein SCO1/2
LTAEDGSILTSEDGRGAITLYTFSRTDCGDDCADIDTTMASVREQVAAEVDLGDVDFRLVTIALDPNPDGWALAAAAAESGADGVSWRWVGGTESELRDVVGSGFRRPYVSTSATDFDPGFILVDGLGVVRGDYRYDTLGDTADKLARHVGILGDELRYANGAAGVAYEAAHLFLCYP